MMHVVSDGAASRDRIVRTIMIWRFKYHFPEF